MGQGAVGQVAVEEGAVEEGAVEGAVEQGAGRGGGGGGGGGGRRRRRAVVCSKRVRSEVRGRPARRGRKAAEQTASVSSARSTLRCTLT